MSAVGRGMVLLRSGHLILRIDPAHGGEVLDLIHLGSGRQLLGRPPFGSEAPVDGELDEETWTRCYRGGWQMLTPNAGYACEVDGERHGFHGRASNAPWTVASSGSSCATLRWTGHGLDVRRCFELVEDFVRVSVQITAPERRAPLVAVEHVALGLELIEPVVLIDLPGGRASEIAEAPSRADPSHCAEWPDVRLMDGTAERHDRWPLERSQSRLLCVRDLPAGWAAVRNEGRRSGVALSWDSDWLRYLWIWHEVRASGGLWRNQTEILIIEPASVPNHLGLAQAIADGEATWLDAGESRSYQIVVRPFAGEGRVEDVDRCGRVTFG